MSEQKEKPDYAKRLFYLHIIVCAVLGVLVLGRGCSNIAEDQYGGPDPVPVRIIWFGS